MGPHRGALVAALVCALGCASAGPSLTLDEGGRFRAGGPGSLSVFVAGSETPLFGELRGESDGLVFVPRFPLRPGVEYRAVYTPPAGAPVTASFRLPAPGSSPSTVVSRVFPSRDLLPENLLKFYLHFSAPMARGEAYRRTHLLDAEGKKVELPFLELGEELWDRSGTRLTLLFDPGRIKRGLKPREDSGPALEEGKSYTLLVESAWPDAEGRTLLREFRKAFRVAAPDDRQPDPSAWVIRPPRAGTTGPLLVELDEPLDEAMLHRAIAVLDGEGRPLAGRVEVDPDQVRWRFHPERTWKPGRHALSIDTTLEDLAGNSIGRPFEVDVVRPLERTITTRTVSLPFAVLQP